MEINLENDIKELERNISLANPQFMQYDEFRKYMFQVGDYINRTCILLSRKYGDCFDEFAEYLESLVPDFDNPISFDFLRIKQEVESLKFDIERYCTGKDGNLKGKPQRLSLNPIKIRQGQKDSLIQKMFPFYQDFIKYYKQPGKYEDATNDVTIDEVGDMIMPDAHLAPMVIKLSGEDYTVIVTNSEDKSDE